MRVLVVGDHFIPAARYIEALAEVSSRDTGPDTGPVHGIGPVRDITWSGTKAEQHAAQQEMELRGPDAVPVPGEIVEAVGDTEVLAVHFAPVSARVLRAAPELRAVCVARTGLENVDVAAATERGVAVVPVHGRNASAVAELALGLMLSEARDIARADASVKAGGWRKDFGGPGDEVGGGTVGMLGMGHVGRELADRLRGFGVRLLVHDPYVPDAVLEHHGAERAADLDTVFRESDAVHVLARLTPETERFIGPEQFALMKPTAYFFNTARSRLVDTGALYAVLASGRIAGAGLDVHDEEPLPADSPWRTLDNVTLTTHYGGDTVTTNERSARLVAGAVAELAATGRCRGAVNARELEWM
ncbi:NAD(P)-dependent oxidoreductase [Streptomyces cucumeris]|uniref:NAD(P)-dependent oxidoreductase n=1 Tax=Streptomyces cucumeris TaxID=2962890 RepID=UPI003D7099BB